MLDGKCKEAFEKWYRVWIYKRPNKRNTKSFTYLEFFYQLPFSMQWGVLLEFFDSVDEENMLDDWYDYFYHPDKSREFAQKQAIEKENKTFNQKAA